MVEILTTADRRFGTRHSRAYYDRALHVAFKNRSGLAKTADSILNVKKAGPAEGRINAG